MTVRILTPTPTCCEPDLLAFNTGQPHATCKNGREWMVVEKVEEQRGRDNWFMQWSLVHIEGRVIA
jgi:hypothetical protein